MKNKENVFAERLKKTRLDNNVSQQELAEHLGITPSSLYYYENGLRTPSINILKKLVERFGVSADWLLGFEKKENTELKTYADMIKLILPLLNYPNIWHSSVQTGLPFDTHDTLGLITNDNEILSFLKDYDNMKALIQRNSVPEDLFQSWIKGRLEICSHIQLPSTPDTKD